MNLYKEIVLDTSENIIEMKKVDELFQLIESTIGGTKNIPGDYKFINQNKKQQDKTHNSYRVEGKNLFIFNLNSIGKCYYYDGKCEFSNLLTCLKPVDETINPKYYYYYFNHIQKIIFDNYCTSACRNKLDIEPFKKLKIHFPSLEIQKRIVEQLDNIYENEIKYSKEVIKSLQFSIETIMKNTMYLDDLVEYKIKDICDFISGKIQSSKITSGDYEFISLENKKINTHSCEGQNIFISTTPCGNGKVKIKYFNGNCDYSCLMSKLEFKIDINVKYFYHLFKGYEVIIRNDYLIGSCNKKIDMDGLLSIKIRIPPPEIQREILKKIEPKERLINQLEKNINRAEKEAKEIMDVLFK